MDIDQLAISMPPGSEPPYARSDGYNVRDENMPSAEMELANDDDDGIVYVRQKLSSYCPDPD